MSVENAGEKKVLTKCGRCGKTIADNSTKSENNSGPFLNVYPMIKSILDTDLYKFRMGEFIYCGEYWNEPVEYRLKVRNAHQINFWKYVDFRVFRAQLDKLRSLIISQDEYNYLLNLNVNERYITFLNLAPFENVSIVQLGDEVIFSGPWASVMLYETFAISIANELFTEGYKEAHGICDRDVSLRGISNLYEKMRLHEDEFGSDYARFPSLSEFGTRRRSSRHWQEEVIKFLAPHKIIQGTSNVYLAKKYNISATGTIGHELFMGYQALYPVHKSQSELLGQWWLAPTTCVLSDTLGLDKFLRDFKPLANLYGGVRHDSGDPRAWAYRMIEFYKTNGINPLEKTLFFSDGLDFPAMIRLWEEFSKHAKVAFGIGTNLTNDVGLPVPQTVMKMTKCAGQPVAKISDNPEKASCVSPEYLNYLKWAIANLP